MPRKVKIVIAIVLYAFLFGSFYTEAKSEGNNAAERVKTELSKLDQ